MLILCVARVKDPTRFVESNEKYSRYDVQAQIDMVIFSRVMLASCSPKTSRANQFDHPSVSI